MTVVPIPNESVPDSESGILVYWHLSRAPAESPATRRGIAQQRAELETFLWLTARQWRAHRAGSTRPFPKGSKEESSSTRPYRRIVPNRG